MSCALFCCDGVCGLLCVVMFRCDAAGRESMRLVVTGVGVGVGMVGGMCVVGWPVIWRGVVWCVLVWFGVVFDGAHGPGAAGGP